MKIGGILFLSLLSRHLSSGCFLVTAGHVGQHKIMGPLSTKYGTHQDSRYACR